MAPRLVTVLILGQLVVGCSGMEIGDEDAAVDAAVLSDAGKDAGSDPIDAGVRDAGPVDAGSETDAGPMDAGPRDAGSCTNEDQRSDAVDMNLGFNDQWQSFTPSRSGDLVEVELTYRSGNPVNLRIFAGEGAGGTMLLDDAMPTRDALGVYRISLTTPVAVVGGSVYTIQIAGVNQQWNASTGSPYTGGRSNRDPDIDFVFATFLTCP